MDNDQQRDAMEEEYNRHIEEREEDWGRHIEEVTKRFEKKRVSFIVTVDLDPIPGDMHTPESAALGVLESLNMTMPHYNPEVILAHAMSQPGYTQSE